MSKSLLVVAVCAGLAGVAAAQDRPPLRGPEVREQRVPGVRQPFTGEGKGDKDGQRFADRGVPQRMYMEVIGRLRGEEAPEGLRLSEDQEKRIREVNDEFRGAVRDNAGKARDDRPARPPSPDGAPQGGERRPENAPQGGERRPEKPGRERLEEIRRNGPKAAEAQTKIWEILTPGQQEFVKGELGKAREKLERERTEQSAERFVRERRAKAAEGAPPPRPEAQPGQPRPGDAPARPLAGPGRERLRHIADMLAQLEPEERDRLLSRIEEELQKRTEGKPPRERQRGEPKPPPPLDDVRVPAPEPR